MKNLSRYFITITFSLACLILLMRIASWQNIHISNVELSNGDQSFTSTSLPLSQNYIGAYTVKVYIEGITSNSHSFRIYPDDEIHALLVNGTEISLNHISTDQRRNYSSGFIIKIDNLNSNKTNIIEAKLTNQSNPAGFRLESNQRLTYTKGLAIYVTLLVFVVTIMRHLKTTKIQFFIIAIGLAVSVLYLSKTDERTRTFDVFEGGGHKDYIEFLIKNHELPTPGDGWEYHQPPLYYLTAALIKQTAPIDSQLTGELWGQLFALFLWTLFLTSSLAALRLAMNRKSYALILASFAVCLWPSGIIHSIRIGNDLAVYACYSICFFYLLSWWKNRNSITLFWTCMWMALSLLCKSNGLAVAGTLGVLMLLHIYRTARKPHLLKLQKTKLLRDISVASCFFVTAILINFADNFIHYLDGSSQDWLLSNVSEMINPGLRVENNIKNYLVFDSATFIENPFISTWDDQYGRQYFWNFLLRSSLSSEFFFSGELMQAWGIINGILLLSMLLGSMIYIIQLQSQLNVSAWKQIAYRNAPWVMALVSPLVLLLAYRIKVPLSCNTDFRYIYPMLIAILFFSMKSYNNKNLVVPKLLAYSAPLIGLNTLVWIYLLITQ